MNKFSKLYSSLVLAGTLACGISNATAGDDVVTDLPPPQLSKLIDSGAIKIVESFKHASFTGWLVESGNEFHLYWATKDDFVVAGPLIDETGVNLTSKYLEAKKPTPNFDYVLAELEKQQTYISTHANKPGIPTKGVMYVFAEPFCGWCSKIYSQLQPHIEAGLEVRWLPVSFLSAQSPDVVEFFLSSKDPIASMSVHELLRKNRKPLNTKPATEKTKELLEQNSDFMRKFGIKGTPGIVYQLDGKARVGGYMKPSEMSDLVARIQAGK